VTRFYSSSSSSPLSNFDMFKLLICNSHTNLISSDFVFLESQCRIAAFGVLSAMFECRHHYYINTYVCILHIVNTISTAGMRR
jgi:hypothetical protein